MFDGSLFTMRPLPDRLVNSFLSKNSNNNPFLYRSWIETKSDGRQDRIIMIKDTDPDSPSFGEHETVII